MEIATTKLTKPVISLPAQLFRQWQGASVVILSAPDAIIVKRATEATLTNIKPKLKRLGKLITDRELAAALRWARRTASTKTAA